MQNGPEVVSAERDPLIRLDGQGRPLVSQSWADTVVTREQSIYFQALV